jgi:hypothetical protein
MTERNNFKDVPGDVITIATESLSIDDGFNDDEKLVPTGHHMFFCGCCCDFRKATMIIDGILIALQSIMLGVMIFGAYIISSGTDIYDNLQSQLEKELDDDAMIKSYSDLNAANKNLIESSSDQLTAASLGAAIAMLAVPIVFSAIGLYGALKFKNWALITNAVAISIKVLLQLINVRISGIFLLYALFQALCLYPHVMMIHLVRNGIMTPKNYRNIDNFRA